LTVFPDQFTVQFSSTNQFDVDSNDLKSLYVIKLSTCDRVMRVLKSYPQDETRILCDCGPELRNVQ